MTQPFLLDRAAGGLGLDAQTGFGNLRHTVGIGAFMLGANCSADLSSREAG
jgi:hypothetical protein